MDAFSALLAFCAGNSPVTVEFPSQSPVTRSFDIFFDRHLNKRLSKHRETGDLRRRRAPYDITVMSNHASRAYICETSKGSLAIMAHGLFTPHTINNLRPKRFRPMEWWHRSLTLSVVCNITTVK